jgi:hypothetical protein
MGSLVSFTPVVNSEDADQIRWFEAKKHAPFADAQSQFTGAVFKGLYTAASGGSETHQCGIDPSLNADQDVPDRALRQGGKLRGVSQPEPASDFFQRDVVARFRTGQIQLGRGFGIDDFLLAQFRKKRNCRLYFTVRKGVHERLKAVAVGGHASILASLAISGSGTNIKLPAESDPLR